MFPVFVIFFALLLALFKVIFEFTGEIGIAGYRLIFFFCSYYLV